MEQLSGFGSKIPGLFIVTPSKFSRGVKINLFFLLYLFFWFQMKKTKQHFAHKTFAVGA